MKFPEQRLSMETALPPSVQNWLGHELEIRGIDSMVYCRHVIQLLQQEDPDEHEYADYVDLLFESKIENKLRGRKPDKRKSSPKNTEERKKNAAIECLQAVSDEDSGIETLVEELCNRLKNINNIDGNNETTLRELSPSSTESDASSSELDDPAERYYAAFPALHGQDKKNSASPFPKESVHLWQNNPITKLQITADDSSKSENKDSGNESETEVQVEDKRSTKETKTSQIISEKNPYGERPTSSGRSKQQPKRVNSKKLKENQSKDKNEYRNVCRFLSWPQDAPSKDLKQSISMHDNHNNQDKELCSQVENLLKDMLLHKDDTHSCAKFQDKKSRGKLSGEESVSPELQEDDSWYTQPIDVLFSSEEPRQRLYKRNSNPLFPTTEESDFYASTLSSPFQLDNEDENALLDKNLSDLKEIFNESENLEQHQAVDKPMYKDQSSHETYDNYAPSYDAFASKLLGYGVATSPMTIPKSNQKITDAEEDSVLLCSFISGHNSSMSTYDNLANSFVDSLSSSNSQSSVIDKAIEDVLESDLQSTTPCMSQEPLLEGSLLDREYLKNITQISSGIESSCWSWSPQMSDTYQAHLGFSETENSPWPSKVLFADVVLPVDWIWEQGEIDYNADFYSRLKYGKLWQVWDVSYQKIKGSHSWKPDLLGPLSYSLNIWDPDENSLGFLTGDYLFHESEDYYWLNGGLQSLTDLGDQNTLIPEITFDLVSDYESDYDNLPADDENDIFTDDSSEQDIVYGRSCSFGDFQLLHSLTEKPKGTKDKLSQSFELVPSECSAFVDVIPKKIYHVQSEPNLVSYCRDMQKQENTPMKGRKSKSDSQSPEQEHLYFSPKTHFRPIQTPVHPEVIQDFHLRDLFGGYASSKTPYQKYVEASSSDSGDESFVPMFKIRKDMDKYIQTGSSLDEANTVKSTHFQCGNLEEESELSCPQDIPRNMIHDKDFAEEFDVFGYVDSLTHSAENTPLNLTDYMSSICLNPGSCHFTSIGNGLSDNNTIQDHCQEEEKGETGYGQQNSVCQTGILISEEEWKDKLSLGDSENQLLANCTCPTEEQEGIQNIACVNQNEANDISYGTKTVPHQWVINEAWGLDPGQKANKEAYSIWQCNQDSDHFQDFFFYAEHENADTVSVENDEKCLLQSVDMVKSSNNDDDCMAYTQSYKEMAIYMTEDATLRDFSNANDTCLEYSDLDVSHKEDMPLDDSNKNSDETDIVKVKLVIRKNKRKSDFEDSETVHSNLYVPMPVAALYSCELEEAWINGESVPPDLCIKSSVSCQKGTVKKKPCSFFMEGHCRRTDCKFAHDLSCITCRFWEEGDCFKGDMCPFLHGYHSLCTSPEDQSACFEYQPEEFPDLSEPQKNGSKVKMSKMKKPRAFRQSVKLSKSQTGKKISSKDDRSLKRSTDKKTSRQKNSL